MGGLTTARVKHAGAGKHEDGQGLRLVVAKSGARKWVLRYQINGRRREMGLGTFPTVSLKDARDRADDARKLAGKGIDPIDQRNTVEVSTPTFTAAAARFIRAKRHEWGNPKHARQWVSTLKTYARPVIGAKPVDDISTADVLRILSPMWTAKTETAKRVQGRIENVIDFAAAQKWRTDPLNPARWRGHLDKLLASPNKVKAQRNGGTGRHHPALPYTDVPGFVLELRRLNSVSASALRFLILTATRTNEVLQAQWSEFDLEAAVWTIPAARMKARKEHRVPLAPAALDVLASLPRVEGNPYVFVGARHGRPLSNMALLQVMRGMGYGVGGDRGDAVPHGFRSSFRDWAGEVSSYPHDVCEMALAHVIANKAEAAYRRGDLFTKRRAMMEQWADWCATPAAAVVELADRTEAHAAS